MLSVLSFPVPSGLLSLDRWADEHRAHLRATTYSCSAIREETAACRLRSSAHLVIRRLFFFLPEASSEASLHARERASGAEFSCSQSRAETRRGESRLVFAAECLLDVLPFWIIPYYLSLIIISSLSRPCLFKVSSPDAMIDLGGFRLTPLPFLTS